MESIRLRVARSDPEQKTSSWAEYTVELKEKTTVLDCLDRVQRTEDPSLAFRYACRMGMCGSCVMLVNGKERWTCRTLVSSLGASELKIQPLRHLPVIRDLAVDFGPLWEKYRKVKPAFEPGVRRRRPKVGVESSIQCISCAACYSSCTFVGTDPLYLGPHALNRAFTLVEDGRDGARDARLAIVDDEHGCWKCHVQENCTEVCPMDLRPSASIQHLKRAIVEKRLLNPTRRKFAFATLGALGAAVGGYLFSERERVWVTVGPLESIPTDTFTPFEFEGRQAYLRRTSETGVVAFSQRCSHQGCIVAWDGGANQFKCPCHFGTFTASGQVVSGRPVRPLAGFETRLEGGNVQVLI